MQQAHEAESLPVFSLRTLLEVLMARAEPHLTQGDLRWLFGGCSDTAGDLALYLAHLTEGIGCLVVNDGPGTGHIGSFQDASECSRLLFFLSHQASLQGGLQGVIDAAARRLRMAKAQQ
ncbi:MAG: hypothetical protein L0H08_20925 [Comamonas sp.]|nr:hypothetical protein [Comamonas sp.]